ncbi:cilia- and flagella-associated protein 77-like [Monodelphis domestica]|uniref:cilia- and flagella-associated protein 77-like n=1 Tax=Monodelphis domestica TaxID=13616 RepID=UPI0000F2B32F|nr:cilia- and flagella-associated protein 77-like [Monodelphis domestica]
MASLEQQKSESPLQCRSFNYIRNTSLPPLLPLRRASLTPEMENYRHGCMRDSMLCNHLILKPELGRTRRNCSVLPGFDFAYGKPNCYEDSVAKTIGQWNIHSYTTPLKVIPSNFISLNAKAVQAGFVTPAEHHVFRRSYPKIKEIKKNKPSPEIHIPKKPANDPKVNIADLMQEKFKNQWRQERILQDSHCYKKTFKFIPKVGYYETYGTKIKPYHPNIKPSPPWRMAQFQKAKSCLNTFSDEEIHQKSLKNFRAEAPARCGTLSLGIYTNTV